MFHVYDFPSFAVGGCAPLNLPNGKITYNKTPGQGSIPKLHTVAIMDTGSQVPAQSNAFTTTTGIAQHGYSATKVINMVF